jgi:UDP-N-acetyl-2-amino-2-deoxyglucuronate dehydrogenase
MKYKVGLIGCGRISFKHIEAIINNQDGLELAAVCDLVKERAMEKSNDYQRHFAHAKITVYTDYRELLADKNIDIVSIATESGNHAAITIDALNSGKHVIVEKPMALSTGDADKMGQAAAKMKRKLAVCFQNRFNEPVQKTYAALKNGRFGKILHAMVQVRWNRGAKYYQQALWRGTWEHDGGTLMNQCTHGIDLLQWLMGEDIVRVYGVTRRFIRPIEAEDFGAAILEGKNGAVGIIEGSADIYPKNLNETLSLFGETGTVVIGGLAVNKIEAWRFADCENVGDIEMKMLAGSVQDPPTVYGYGHTAIYADFAAAIKDDREPYINGPAGKKALEIILAIYKSMKESRPVDLPTSFSTSEMSAFSWPK